MFSSPAAVAFLLENGVVLFSSRSVSGLAGHRGWPRRCQLSTDSNIKHGTDLESWECLHSHDICKMGEGKSVSFNYLRSPLDSGKIVPFHMKPLILAEKRYQSIIIAENRVPTGGSRLRGVSKAVC